MNNKLIVSVLFAFLSLCGVTYIYAQEKTDTSMSASGVSIGKEIKGFLTNLHGKLKLNLFDHFHEWELEETGERDTDRYRFEFDLKLDFTGSIGDSITYFVKPRFRFDSVGWATGTIDELNETAADRFMLNIDETYLTYTSHRFDISFGKKIYQWGTADGYNPTNNINSSDFTDVPTAEKIGVPSISLNYSHDMFNVELVFVPLFSPSRLPDIDNRWFGDFRDAIESSGILRVIPNPGREELPANNIDNAQYAIRISSSTLVNGWDFSLSYYDGLAPIGVLRGELDLSLPLLEQPSRIKLSRVFPHCREFGADFSTTFNKLEIHGEAAAHYTDGDKMDDDYIEFVVGINYNLDSIPFDFLEEIRMVLEYACDGTFDKKLENSEFVNSNNYYRPFKNSVLTNIDFKFSEDTRFKIFGALNLDDDDSYIRPLFSHKLYEHTKCEVGFDVISGKKDTFFGKWRQNDRFFITFTRYF